MSLDFYPATLVEMPDGTKHWQNVVPMQGDCERLRPEARRNENFEGSAFEPNPEFIPFSSMNMSGGNAYTILRMIGIKPGDDWCGNAPIDEVFKKAHSFMFIGGRVRDMEDYALERIFALREMARLGRARGATHIVWS